MFRFSGAAAFLVLALATLARPAAAQNRPFYFLGAGLTVPTGDYGDYAKTGWMLDGGIGMPAGTDGKLWFGGEGTFGVNDHEGDSGDKTTLYGAHGNVGYQFVPDALSPYVYGSAGFLVHKYSPGTSGIESSSEAAFAWGGGAGVSAPMGSASLWVEARFISRGDTRFIPFMVGVSLGGS